MAGDALQNIGLSALLSYQRALQVTSHNIANASTPGYSRQSVSLASVQGQVLPVGSLGAGVSVSQIRRSFDQLLYTQLIDTNSGLAQSRVMSNLTELLDNYLGADGFDLSTSINQLSASLDGLATDPTSTAARTQVLSDARALVDRFNVLNSRLEDVRTDVNGTLQAQTREINQLTEQIADLNVRISQRPASDAQPLDLLDQRDEAVRRLSELVDISVVQVDGNVLNVTLSNGQNLVVGGDTIPLTTAPSQYDPRELVVALDTPAGPQRISNFLAGGELAGTISFLRDVLTPTQNEIGRIAMGFANSFNEQHIRGLDLNGNLGTDFFNVATPEILPASTNSNLLTDTTSVSIDDFSQLTGDEYQLDFDGATWSLTNITQGTSVALVPSGPDFLADGLRISVDPGAVAGDSYRVRPTRAGARRLDLLITEPSQIAAAGALSVSPAATNTGSGSASSVQVLDPTDPTLLNPVNITFDSPTTFHVNGGPSQAYTPGADIVVGPWQIQISGAPVTGDSFDITSNVGAEGNSDNALALSVVDRLEALEGGTLSASDLYRGLISSIGVQGRSFQAATEIQTSLVEDLNNRMSEVQGVNLDEEALNLQMYQQAYTAAAEIFRVSNEVFQTLLASVR